MLFFKIEALAKEAAGPLQYGWLQAQECVVLPCVVPQLGVQSALRLTSSETSLEELGIQADCWLQTSKSWACNWDRLLCRVSHLLYLTSLFQAWRCHWLAEGRRLIRYPTLRYVNRTGEHHLIQTMNFKRSHFYYRDDEPVRCGNAYFPHVQFWTQWSPETYTGLYRISGYQWKE